MDDPKLWKIIAGVTVGMLLAGAISFGVRMWIVKSALQDMTQTIEQTSQRMVERSKQQVKTMNETARAEQLRRILAKQQEVDRLAAQQRAEAKRQMENVRAEMVSSAAKERAWNRFYSKPSRCENPEGTDFGECANEYIRAKRKFESLYAEGKL